MSLQKFYKELQRRNVVKAAISYLAVSWLILQAASIIFPVLNFTDSAIRVLFYLILLLFPFWLIISWVYDYSAQGFIKTERGKNDETISQKTEKRLNTLIIVVLTLAVLLLLVDRFFLLSGNMVDTEEKSCIAVLPFENLSNNPEQDYFVQGMQTELSGLLSHIKGLRVISPKSTVKFKNTQSSIGEISNELNADFIVDASVLKIGDSIRIQAQLIETRPEENYLWNRAYDREFRHVLVMQSEVTKDIAKSIEVLLSPLEQSFLDQQKEIDPIAFTAYLQGNFHLFRFTPSDIELAIIYYQKALDVDPNFAQAYAGLSDAWSYKLVLGMAKPDEAGVNMRVNAAKSLTLDSLLAEGHFAMGVTHYAIDWDWIAAREEFLRAIEINPNNSKFHIFYSHFLASMGRFDESIEHAVIALQSDPYNVFFHGLYAAVLNWAGKYEEAITQCNIAIEINPLNPFVLAAQAVSYECLMEKEKAYNNLIKAYSLVGNMQLVEVLNSGFEEGGIQKAYQTAAEYCEEEWRHGYVKPHFIVSLFSLAGNTEKALDWLDSCYVYKDHDMIYSAVNQYTNEIKQHKRYIELLGKMNLLMLVD